jgi:hypothetical protein
MAIPWIFEVQDLSVDKAVDSVNKLKWTPMVTDGFIMRFEFT